MARLGDHVLVAQLGVAHAEHLIRARLQFAAIGQRVAGLFQQLFGILAARLPMTDIVLFDLKHLDPERHKAGTGVDNRLILENLEKLSAAGADVWVRIPVVPGYNDDPAFHKAAARFLAGLPHPPARIDLLPFHNWCESKYDWLGLDWPLKTTEAMAPFFLEMPAEVYRDLGLNVTIGGSGFEEAAVRSA